MLASLVRLINRLRPVELVFFRDRVASSLLADINTCVDFKMHILAGIDSTMVSDLQILLLLSGRFSNIFGNLLQRGRSYFGSIFMKSQKSRGNSQCFI